MTFLKGEYVCASDGYHTRSMLEPYQRESEKIFAWIRRLQGWSRGKNKVGLKKAPERRRAVGWN